MLMIIGHHLTKRNPTFMLLHNQPPSVSKFVFYVFIYGGGWIGNVIFFTVSAWFLAGDGRKEPSVKSGFKRAWLLEREVLFYSFSIYVALKVLARFTKIHLGIGLFVTATPILHDIWWYATSYMIFVIFAPILVTALHGIGQKKHALLCVVSLILWGVFTLIPKVNLDFVALSVFAFIYWFVLVSYYRWYMNGFSVRQCWELIICGELIYMACWFITNFVPRFRGLQEFIFLDAKLPSLMIGFGLFVLFERVHFCNGLINWIASTMFGVYLIHQHPAVNDLLWVYLFPFTKIWSWQHSVVKALLIIVCILVFGIVVDSFRRLLFTVTIDRHKGRWFDICWDSRIANNIRTKILQYTNNK